MIDTVNFKCFNSKSMLSLEKQQQQIKWSMLVCVCVCVSSSEDVFPYWISEQVDKNYFDYVRINQAFLTHKIWSVHTHELHVNVYIIPTQEYQGKRRLKETWVKGEANIRMDLKQIYRM